MTAPTFELPRIVDQAILHTPDGRPGDCLRACVATITDRALLEVPHFVELGDAWWDVLRGYVKRWSLGKYEIQWFPPRPQPRNTDDLTLGESWGYEPGYAVILAGPSPRGDFGHVVVGDPVTGRMIHDPHPSRAGILETDYVMAIVAAAG